MSLNYVGDLLQAIVSQLVSIRPRSEREIEEFEDNELISNIIKTFCKKLSGIYSPEYIRNFKNKSNRFIKRLLDSAFKNASIVDASKQDIYSCLIENLITMGSNYLMKDSLLRLMKVFKENKILNNSVLPDSTIIFFLCEDPSYSKISNFAD